MKQMKQMTLQEANEYLWENGIEITLNNGTHLTDFFSYYFYHYAPNINNQKIGRFFADDMRALFGTELMDTNNMEL